MCSRVETLKIGIEDARVVLRELKRRSDRIAPALRTSSSEEGGVLGNDPVMNVELLLFRTDQDLDYVSERQPVAVLVTEYYLSFGESLTLPSMKSHHQLPS